MRLPLVLIGSLATLLLVADPAAAWPTSSTVNVPVCLTPAFEEMPVIVSDEHGGSFVLWADDRGQEYGFWQLFAQRLDRNGRHLWTRGGAYVAGRVQLTIPGEPRSSYDLVADGKGGAFIIWAGDTYQSGVTYVLAQHLGADGSALWDSGGLRICDAGTLQWVIATCSDGSGGFITAWRDHRENPTHDSGDIYAQRVSAEGVPLWQANGVPVCRDSGDENWPAAVATDDGGAIIAWCDERPEGGPLQVYAQRLSAAGDALWTLDGVHVESVLYGASPPAVVSDAAGGAVLAWKDIRSNADGAIVLQRLDGAGQALWSSGVNVSHELGNEPALVRSRSHGVIVAWSGRCPSGCWPDRSVGRGRGQRLDGSGNELWAAGGVPLTSVPSGQSALVGVADGSGGAVFAWADDRNDPGYWHRPDVYAQRLTERGDPADGWPTEGLAVCTADLDQYNVAISATALGPVIAWEDQRNQNVDIYAQRVRWTGTLGGPAGVRSTLLTVNTFASGERGAETNRGPMEIYDVRGRKIATATSLNADGRWSGCDDAGHRLPPGVYLSRVTIAGRSYSSKLALTR